MFTYHPPKLTWQWKIHHLKMYLLLNMGIFQCHVSFQGCMFQGYVGVVFRIWIPFLFAQVCVTSKSGTVIFHSQPLNVWSIYLHLGNFYGFHVGKYTIHWSSGTCFSSHHLIHPFFDDQSLFEKRPSHVSPYVGIFHHPPGSSDRWDGDVLKLKLGSPWGELRGH